MTDAADAVIDLYRRHARAWTRARVAQAMVEEGWLERFRRLLRVGGTVLDIGCGAGVPVARHFVSKGHPVLGIDSSPAMIALFEDNLPGMAAQLADMRSLRLDRGFDGLIAWDSFFHLSPADQRSMFAVFRDHAEPLAPLMFTSGPAHGEAIGTLEGEPLYHASLDEAEYRALLDHHGFDVVRFVAEDPGCGGRSVWLARRRQARRPQ